MEGAGWLFRGSWGPPNASLTWAGGDKSTPEARVRVSGNGVKEAERTMVFPPSAAFPKSVWLCIF